MKTINLVVQLTYDDQIIHGDTEEDIEWFYEYILKNTNEDEGLLLHSKSFGEDVGEIKVLEII